MKKFKSKRKLASVLLVMLSIIMLMTSCGNSSDNKPSDPVASDPVASEPAATEPQATEPDATEPDATEPDETEPAETDPASDEGDIKIGGLAPLTGGVSVYGIAVNNGVMLAIDEVNKSGGVLGRQIEYIVYDEKGDQVEATNAYNRLVNDDKIVALIGDVTSGPSIAVAQRAAIDNMPMITASGTSAAITEQGSNVFRACYTDEIQGDLMGAFAAKELNLTKVAVLYNVSDDYSQGLTDAFEARCEEEGVEVVALENYSDGDTDFKTQLTRIAAADPEALYVPNYYNDNIMIVRQAKQVGLDVPFLGGDGWDGVLSENVIGSEKNDADGSYFANHYAQADPNEFLQSFLTTYRETYDMEAVSFAALGYDAAHMMLQAIENAGSTDSQAIVDAMKNLEYDGVTGSITFDENNNPIKTVSIILIEDGEYTLYTKMHSGE